MPATKRQYLSVNLIDIAHLMCIWYSAWPTTTTMSPEIRIPHKIISDIGVLSCEHNRGVFCYEDWFGLGWIEFNVYHWLTISAALQYSYGTKLPSEWKLVRPRNKFYNVIWSKKSSETVLIRPKCPLHVYTVWNNLDYIISRNELEYG